MNSEEIEALRDEIEGLPYSNKGGAAVRARARVLEEFDRIFAALNTRTNSNTPADVVEAGDKLIGLLCAGGVQNLDAVEQARREYDRARAASLTPKPDPLGEGEE